jgi:hypothetical protein
MAWIIWLMIPLSENDMRFFEVFSTKSIPWRNGRLENNPTGARTTGAGCP